MIDPGKAVKQSTKMSAPHVNAAPKLIAGAIFGLMFGFLLQKGGVGKYNVLIGQLLLQVAVANGAIVVFFLEKLNGFWL